MEVSDVNSTALMLMQAFFGVGGRHSFNADMMRERRQARDRPVVLLAVRNE